MKPIEFDGMVGKFTLPDGTGELPYSYADDGRSINTLWELSDEDIEMILQTRQIVLTIAAFPPPPVGLAVNKVNSDTIILRGS